MTQSAWIHDISGDDFKRIVIDGSGIQPVLVDFWAPWCAPCRTLGPILESLIGQYAGRIHLARVNIDEHPALAQSYGIQGIPAVKLFHEGRIVEAFVGVQSGSFIQNLIDKHIPKPETETVDHALAAAWRGEIREARATLNRVREQHPDDAHIVLASCLVDILHGDSAQARQTFDQLPASALADSLYERVRSLLYFVSLLEQGLGQLPPALAARLSMGARQILAGRGEAAVEDWLAALPETGPDERSRLQEAIRTAFPLVGQEDRRLEYQRRLARSLH
ncbi:MAG: thioredoxin family protein [Gammaproteobacteria bacterium]